MKYYHISMYTQCREWCVVSRTARDGLRVAVAGPRWTVYPSVASHVIHLVVGWGWSLCGEGGREGGREEGGRERGRRGREGKGKKRRERERTEGRG